MHKRLRASCLRREHKNNISRVTEKIFVVSGYHCSLWPKVTRVERFLKFSGSNPDCKGIGHKRDGPDTGAW